MSEQDDIPQSGDHKLPKFIHLTWIVLLIGGIYAFFVYWNGSSGWLDRGSWKELQHAARTTFPFEEEIPYLSEEEVLKINGSK